MVSNRVLWLLACAPVVFVALRVAVNLRNIPYWDEFDTVLNYLLGLDTPEPWTIKLERLFAVQNEHRIFTSRVLFTLLYRFTGTVNFAVIGVIGNLFLVGLCALLVQCLRGRAGAAGTARLAAVIGLVVFQLEHHENLFWSGSSIDHFNVVLLATGAFGALAGGTRRGLLDGLLLGVLGTYTLAHGFMIWPVGAALLVFQRRWRELAWWSGVALAMVACYAPGFFINPEHHIEASAQIGRVLLYWLTLLGATPTCGELAVAPWLGACLLGCIGWLARARAWRDVPLAAAVVAFCILALALVAVGRTGVSAGFPIPSRYYILSALPWALTLWVAVERGIARRECGPRCLVALAVGLVAFNITSDVRFFGNGAQFANQREHAAQRFRYYHTFGGSRFAVFPHVERADEIMQEVEQRGIFRMPNPTERVEVTLPVQIDNITYRFDEVKMDAENVYLRGWAVMPNHESERDELHIVFQSERTFLVYKALTVRRPDVVESLRNPQASLSGFRLTLPRSELPQEDLSVGVLFKPAWGRAEFIVTPHQLALASHRSEQTPLLTTR